MATPKIKVTKDIIKIIKRNESNTHISRADNKALPQSTTSITVSFTTNMPDASYVVVPSINNIVDSFPTRQVVQITAQSKSSFTATWDFPLDTASYTLSWILSEVNDP